MMRYVIVRTSDGAYVAQPGSAHSYTHRLERARVYASLEQAERDRCGNERVVDAAVLAGSAPGGT